MKGIIYYTSNRIKSEIKEGCWKQLQKSELPITVNDKPLEKIGALSMFHQITDCLERSKEKYVFFCEHDVLYHPSHFDFMPTQDDEFYYNVNVWRWDYYSKKVITYNHHVSVSGLCTNREFALDFYHERLKLIYENGWDKIPTHGNPVWARELGYEPGKDQKKSARIEHSSIYPNIDIRHTRCMTHPKMNYEDFVVKPKNWKEDIIDNLPGWDEPWLLVQ